MKDELEEKIPSCAELTLAIRKLQEFQFWAEQSIDISGMRGARPIFEEKKS